ncbi:MAG: DUF4392 domain-containing protein [Heteroscytonema crispum UTEX LB 1556]
MPYTQEILKKIAQLETICGRDVGRGIEPLFQVAKGGLLGAARAIAEHYSPHVAIITGFFLPDGNPPAPETDGLIGCAQLAAGLNRAGIPVRIVTDDLCINAVKTAVVAADAASIPFDIVPVEKVRSHQQSVAALLNLWESTEPPVSHVISIERAGPGADGIIRNMRGQDITAHTPPLHLLFGSNKIISVGIGDGGNELGMGNIPFEIISQNIRYGEKIACITKSDHLIVCGVSNWGATGLLTALSLLRPDWKAAIVLGLNTDIELQILKTTVKHGPAVDGIKGVQSLSVDNLPWEIHAQMLRELTQLMG